MKRVIWTILLGTLPLSAGGGSEADATGPVTQRSESVEIFRYEATPPVELDAAARRRVSAALGDAAVLETYVVVVNLEPQRRFVSARVDVHDGFVFVPRRRPTWSLVGKLAVRLGYEVATREAPPGVRETLGALPAVLPDLEARRDSKRRLRRRVTLKAGDVEHHGDYASTVVHVAGSSFTRLQVGRVVTRPVGRGRRARHRTGTAALPGSDDRVASPEAVRSILGGRRGRPRLDRGLPPG